MIEQDYEIIACPKGDPKREIIFNFINSFSGKYLHVKRSGDDEIYYFDPATGKICSRMEIKNALGMVGVKYYCEYVAFLLKRKD